MVRHPEGNTFFRDMSHDYPVIERGEGVYLYDGEGRRYLDASGGPLVVNIGHGVPSVVQAMAEQAARVAYVHGSIFTTAALEEYGRRLAARVPLSDPRFFYLSSGSEAVEAAVKFCRQVQVARGEQERHLVISRWGSYHGATLGALALSGKPSMRVLYASMFRDMPHIEPPYCYRCPLGAVYPACDLACARQLEKEILRQGPGRVAAFIAEPIGGATQGCVVPPTGYWPLVREICDRYQVMLVADEVLTGFGRSGTWFAVEHLDIQPDVITLGKGAAGGYVPLSILGVCGQDVERIRQVQGNFNHGGTFSHHVVGAAAALATLNYIEEHGLIIQAAARGAYLGHKLRDMRSRLPCVGDVRGIGMMWAVEFVADRERKTPFPAERRFSHGVAARCREMGVLLYPGHGGIDGVSGDHLTIAPPYTITEDQIDSAIAVLTEGIQRQLEI
jgi:adenosylmethionine-8-amino-7-oxononanoate aminotransferase